MARQEAYEIVRTSAMEARESGRHVKEVLVLRPEVTEFISVGEIEGVMDPEGRDCGRAGGGCGGAIEGGALMREVNDEV